MLSVCFQFSSILWSLLIVSPPPSVTIPPWTEETEIRFYWLISSDGLCICCFNITLHYFWNHHYSTPPPIKINKPRLFTVTFKATQIMAVIFWPIWIWFLQTMFWLLSGNLVSSTPNITIVRTANQDEPPVSLEATLKLTADGKLVVSTEGRR